MNISVEELSQLISAQQQPLFQKIKELEAHIRERKSYTEGREVAINELNKTIKLMKEENEDHRRRYQEIRKEKMHLASDIGMREKHIQDLEQILLSIGKDIPPRAFMIRGERGEPK